MERHGSRVQTSTGGCNYTRKVYQPGLEKRKGRKDALRRRGDIPRRPLALIVFAFAFVLWRGRRLAMHIVLVVLTCDQVPREILPALSPFSEHPHYCVPKDLTNAHFCGSDAVT